MSKFSEPQANQSSGESSEFSYVMIEKPGILQGFTNPQASAMEHQIESTVHKSNASKSIAQSQGQAGQMGDNARTGIRHQTHSAEGVMRANSSGIQYKYSYHLQVPSVGHAGDLVSALQVIQHAATPKDHQVYQWLLGLQKDENIMPHDDQATLAMLHVGTKCHAAADTPTVPMIAQPTSKETQNAFP